MGVVWFSLVFGDERFRHGQIYGILDRIYCSMIRINFDQDKAELSQAGHSTAIRSRAQHIRLR